LDVRGAIDTAQLLGEMPPEDRAALARAATSRRLRAGQHLWRAGDRENGLVIVVDGLVHIGLIGPDGEEIVLHVHGPGELMGEPAIFAPEGDRRTDARAVVPTTVVMLRSEDVRRVLEGSPEAMRLFVRRVSAIARSHSRRVALTAFHDARGRLARLLLDLVESHGVKAPRGHRIALPLSQRALAGLVSLRRESVNRLVAAFEREGAIVFEDGSITVLAPHLLRAALGVEALLP
jgi:CRP/FNR family cyclic AMP-dependent transcriptional regulator